MARIKLHSETFYGLNRQRLTQRVIALQDEYPLADVKARRLPRYGNGYTISVHGEGQPTRVQRRGHCQFCGNHQVVKDGVLVLHGYQRPGHGWIFGRCPGAGELPLQSDETITRAALSASQARLRLQEQAQPKLIQAEVTAKARYEAEEPGMVYATPSEPYSYRATEEEKAQIMKAYQTKLQTWYEAHPATKAYLDAMNARRSNESALRQTQDQILHFETLLGWKLLGTPLLEVAK